MISAWTKPGATEAALFDVEGHGLLPPLRAGSVYIVADLLKSAPIHAGVAA